jgi:ribokinase
MYDVITVGSGTVDVFVDTKSKEIRKHGSHEDVCYVVGDKVLIKELHYSTGGGGTNTAVGFSRMGLKSAWYGVVGKDANMHYLMETCAEEKVDFLGYGLSGKSGYSVVLTGLKKDRTILTYKGVNNQLSLRSKDLKIMNPKWFYFSSMIGKGLAAQKKLAAHARKKNIPYAYNPSCYLTEGGMRRIGSLVKKSSMLVMNDKEAGYLLGTSRRKIKSNVESLLDYADTVAITAGGKRFYASDGKHMYSVNPLKCKVVETTGAGDSFATGLLSGIIKKKSFEKSIRMGCANSNSVIGAIGAKNHLLTMKQAIRKKGAVVKQVGKI